MKPEPQPATQRFASVESLAVLVWRAQKRAAQANAPAGRREQLQSLALRIDRIRKFESSDAPKRIGVFGAPKRGKSTLLNALLGHDLLPTSPMPLSTTTIEVVRAAGSSGWAVTVHLANGRVEHHETNSDRTVANLLERYGSRRGAAVADRLKVCGAFDNCSILTCGGVLLDTPGAEIAFEAEADVPLRDETERALKALTDTHIVLFCTRADQIGSRTDFEFYEQHVRPLSPLHVITCKDKWTEDHGALLDEAMRQYGISEDHVIPVSAHEAIRLRSAGADLEPSGLVHLEELVLKELARLSPEDGLLPCLKEFQRVLEQDHSLRPERVHFENLRSNLQNGGAKFASALHEIGKDPEFWKVK